MGIIKVMITGIVLLTILGGTIWITRLGMEKFIDLFLGKEKK